MANILAEQERRHLPNNLRTYVERAWSIVEPATPYIPGWHIDAICEHLEAVSNGQIKRLIINMPPRHMKSLLVGVFWMTWEWTRNPALRYLYASYAADLATRDSVKCRRIIESPWYRHRWGREVRLTGDQNAKTRFENTATGQRLSTGVGGMATGEGGDRIVVDDAHKVDEVESDVTREAVLDWWDGTMLTRGNGTDSVKVIVGQRIHERDLPGHLLGQGGWELLCLPGEYEPKTARSTAILGFTDPRTKPGELLWPARFGREDFIEFRKMGSYRFAAQFQQTPAPAGGGLVKRAWWQYYDEATLPKDFDTLVQSWDLAFKDADTSDYVVGQVWGRKGANCYLLDMIRDRLDFPATVRAFEAWNVKWAEARTKLVEDAANGPAIIAQLRSKVQGLIPISPKGSKEARVSAVSPFIESGNVFLPSPKLRPWIDDFLTEWTSFPKGAHDDMVDAGSQALERIAGLGRRFDMKRYSELLAGARA